MTSNHFTKFRRVILSLLLLATTHLYLDFTHTSYLDYALANVLELSSHVSEQEKEYISSEEVGTDGYAIPFAIAGSGYLIALIIAHLLVPKIKSINI